MTAALFGCLKGVRVLDLSRYLPGPLATLWLADFGAEVIKVEPPGGEGMCTLGPRDAEGRGLWHAALNANKRILTLDLAQADGRQTLRALLQEADVLVESFRPGVMERLGLAPDELRRRHPHLVIASLSGYGQHGPLRDAAGHDNTYLAQAGFLAGVGPSPAQPSLVWPPLADSLGSLFALSAILGALLARQRAGSDGQGCHIDLALADVAMPLLVFPLAETGRSERQPPRGEGLLAGGWACYGLYRTACGREFALGAVEPKFWAAFCQAARRPDWMTRQAEPLPQHALRAEVQAWFSQHSADEIERQFVGVDCCLAKVLSLEEALHSPYVRSRGLVRTSTAGPGSEAAFPIHVDGQPPPLREVAIAEGGGAARA